MKPSGDRSVDKVQVKQFQKYYKKPEMFVKQRHTPKFQGNQCGYCGLTGAHRDGQNCPAYGKKCGKCHRWNHYTSVCKSGMHGGGRDSGERNNPSRRESYTWRGRQQRQIKKTTEQRDDSDISSDGEYFDQKVKHIEIKQIQQAENHNKTVMVRIDDVDTHVEPDSGADVNIMDEHQFKALQNRSNSEISYK
jgi:hypothetical protein